MRNFWKYLTITNLVLFFISLIYLGVSFSHVMIDSSYITTKDFDLFFSSLGIIFMLISIINLIFLIKYFLSKNKETFFNQNKNLKNTYFISSLYLIFFPLIYFSIIILPFAFIVISNKGFD